MWDLQKFSYDGETLTSYAACMLIFNSVMNDLGHFQLNFPGLLSSGKQEKETFSERDRELFLEICGVERLSQCVTTEAQTEIYRPCPTVQTLVRQIVPYIQRFIFHNADFDDVYSELKESGIAKCIRLLSFGQVRWRRFLQNANPTNYRLLHHVLSQGRKTEKFVGFFLQVGKLYIHYRLAVPDEDPIYESEDIICHLKDKKELYIHKDHLSAKLDICRYSICQ